VPIPTDVQQVVLLAGGVRGIAPMLQTIYTLLETRRGDGISTSRRPDIHVVWFNQKHKPESRFDAENGIPDLSREAGAAPFEGIASTIDKVAHGELEKLRLLHPDKLAIELIDAGTGSTSLSSFPSLALEVIESSPSLRPSKRTFLQRLQPALHLQVPNSAKLLFIAGSRGFGESLAGGSESTEEDRPGIVKRTEQAGWGVVDLSEMKVCT